MDYVAYFQAKAAQCRHFADIASNQELRGLLDELAKEFEAEAQQAQAQGREPQGTGSRHELRR